MTGSSRSIVIANYDFRSSGTVKKSIEMAKALSAAQLPVELWVIRAQGPMLERVPAEIPVIEVADRGPAAYGRSIDLGIQVRALGRKLRQRTPTVFLSGGNHFHIPAKMALALSGRRELICFGTRASNSSRRPDPETGEISGGNGFWDRFKFRGSDFVVAVSKELAWEIREADASLDVMCIPNGTDIEHVRRLAAEPFEHPFIASRAEGRPVLVTMGRITPQKGFDVLIEALPYLRDRMRARLLIIGDGSKSELAGLRALAEQKGVAEDVDFLGYHANPFAIMSKADMFVSASRWEGSSNALIEAFACGLPLAATDCPTGNRELLGGGMNGTLAPMNNPSALAEAIITEHALQRSRDEQMDAANAFDLRICLEAWVELLAGYHSQQLEYARGSNGIERGTIRLARQKL